MAPVSDGARLDYASIDMSDEAQLNRLIQEQLGRGGPKHRSATLVLPPRPAPQLPLGQLAEGKRLVADLVQLAAECGKDRKCWQSELLAMKRAMQTSQENAGSAAKKPS